jgi:hypothetical protein
MTSDARRHAIIVLASLGLLVSFLRLRPAPVLSLHWTLPERRSLPERQALAQDMRIYELALFQGSSLSWQSYRSVEHECSDDPDDPVVVQACSIFDDALQHESDRHAIDSAIQLLTSDS